MTKDINQIPYGWIAGGSNAKDYELTLDVETTYNGKPSGFVKSKRENPTGFVTLMQEFSAKKYNGKRMCFSAFLKTKNIKGWSGLWMRIDGVGREVLGFDNMKNRALKGTNDWKNYEIVLDVPKESKLIAFGVLLSGEGSVWINDVHFEEAVGKEVTDMEKPLPAGPVNLNFQSN